jgi:cytochrome c oxidase subunit 2
VIEPGHLRVPVDQPLRLQLRSKDVLHGLFLPYHRVQQDVVPGMTVEIWFTPNKIGRFEILCSQLCGLGHYRMGAIMDVLPRNEFETWRTAAK